MIESDPFFGADSLDRVELIMALEEVFDTEIPDNDAKKIRTVHDALELIEKLKSEQDRREHQKKSKRKKQ